jgi:hypothetical protein
MLTHSQDFITLGYNDHLGCKLMRARCYIFGHAGIEEMAGTFPQSLFLLHASSTISLEVHHPMAQRV